MGMDVVGKAPRSARGRYFRQSVWGWRPLWRYCEVVAPDLTAKVQHAQTNDGDGLNAADSQKLSDMLTAEIDSGRAAAYIAEQKSALEAMPDEPCRYCQATGVRRDVVGIENKMDLRVTVLADGAKRIGWCNGCRGLGSVRPFETYYETSVEEITGWRDFLLDCGGFEIW